MTTQETVCPVVLRWIDQEMQVLAFRHPFAGNQFVKGPVVSEACFYPPALRDLLREQSGLILTTMPRYLGHTSISAPPALWYFFAFMAYDLADTWDHQTEDDSGHVLSFFWHRLTQDLDHQWDPMFRKVLRFIRRNL